MPIHVFTSYRTGSEDFVDQFIERYVGDRRTDFEIFNWKGPNRLPPGAPLNDELRRLIETATIFLAFLDEEYSDGITRDELNYALGRRRARRGEAPCIVPLALHQAGEAFAQSELTGPGKDLAGAVYEPCYNQKGKCYPSEYPRLGDFIRKLGKDHRRAFGAPMRVEPPVVVARGAIGGVVLLGRARGDAAEDGAEARDPETAAAEEVLAGLRAADVPACRAPSGWADSLPAEVGDFAQQQGAVAFVQVLSAPTISAALRKPEVLRSRLDDLVPRESLEQSRLAYWLPDRHPAPPEFMERAARAFDDDPAFRHDTAAGMAEWLGGLAGGGLPKPVAAYQDVEDEFHETLRTKLEAIIGPALPMNPDERELWPFFMNSLEATVASVAKQRPIIITHNINSGTPLADPRELRRATLTHLNEVTRGAEQALGKQGVSDKDVFWLSILVKGNPLSKGNAHKIPTSSEFKLDRWWVLECASNGNDFDFESGPRRDTVTQALAKWGAAG